MKKTSITALVAGTTLAALTFGCGDAANTNVRVNSNNTATVVNTSNSNVGIVNTNANTTSGAYNRNYNARGDYDKDANTYKSEAKNKGESIGSGIEDGWIHFKTRAALFAVDDLRESTINVDVDNNVVTLRGDVGSAAEKAAAEKAAKAVDGVKSVKNNLAIKAGDGPNKNASAGGNTNTKSK